MLGFILITIIPTIFFFLLLPKILAPFKSKYLLIAFGWFAGLYSFTLVTFLLSIIFSLFFSSSVLLVASTTTLILFVFGLGFFIKPLFANIKTLKKKRLKLTDIFLIIFCLSIAILFFMPHLAIKNGEIFRSPIYWDFHWHAALIQNFVYGDNFPPESEVLAHIPMTYHFFGDLVFAIYSAVGLNLVESINFGSILAFAFFLIALIGIGEEFFKSKLIGFFTVLLTLTSSSGHFIYYYLDNEYKGLWQLALGIFTTTESPWNASFIRGSPFDYNGMMFNLFYFLEERHLIFGALYLVFGFWILYKREFFNKKTLVIIGALLGGYIFWHLYVTLTMLCAIIFLLVFDKHKKKTLLLLTGFLSLFLIQCAFIKDTLNKFSEFAVHTRDYPKINLDFGGIPPNDGSLRDLMLDKFRYYYFVYGLKVLSIPLAFALLWTRYAKLLITTMAIIVPTFLLINMVQLSPNDMSENHKWIRPMNTFIDILTAAAIYHLFFIKRKLFALCLGVLFLFFLSISGIIELMPFINSRPTSFYAPYPSPLIMSLRGQSQPKDVFLGEHSTQIHLAGRKLFTGEKSIGADIYDQARRSRLADQLYNTTDIKIFCEITKKYKIDFVESSSGHQPALLKDIPHPPSFKTIDDTKQPTMFINTKELCSKREKYSTIK